LSRLPCGAGICCNDDRKPSRDSWPDSFPGNNLQIEIVVSIHGSTSFRGIIYNSAFGNLVKGGNETDWRPRQVEPAEGGPPGESLAMRRSMAGLAVGNLSPV
jgi:hypothetical protein